MRGKSSTRFAAAVAFALAACRADPPGPVDDGSSASGEVERAIPESGPAPSETAAEDSLVARYDSAWTVTPTGFGPVRVGMSVEEANRVLNGAVGRLDQQARECSYLSPQGWPAAISFMVVNGHIARIDVRERGVATPRGAHVGSTEHEIRTLYAGNIEVQPHKYTQGNYLIVTPATPGATKRRLVFETNGETVERYRAGVLPPVGWVEGCA